MSRSNDPLALSPNWHVDCRLTAELPDDRVVSSRFLVNLPFGVFTVIVLMFFGWKLSIDLSLNANIADWRKKLSDSRLELAAIKQLQREFAVESAKIETARNLVNNRLFIYQFMTQLSHTRPDLMVIDNIESNDTSIIVRGTLGESSQQSTLLIGGYVEKLRKDPLISPHFKEILVSSFDRARGSTVQSFELTFHFLPPEAPP